MSKHIERRALQMAIGVACLVPLGAGLLGVAQGASMLGHAGEVSLDSHMRYLSGLLLGIGLVFASTIPTIERHSDRFAILAAIVIVGGLARLYGVLIYGWPSEPMVYALVMELGVTPLLWFWHHRVAHAWKT
jgi:hypothetical protein